MGNGIPKTLGHTEILEIDFSLITRESHRFSCGSVKSDEALIKVYNDVVMKWNNRLKLICDIYNEMNLSLHDFCQVLGINYTIAKLNVSNMQENDHYFYIFEGIEDSRKNEDWKSNRNGMPMFRLTSKAFTLMLDQNKEAKEKIENFMIHDMGLGEHMLTIKEDGEGNKSLEKYYPKLKALK